MNHDPNSNETRPAGLSGSLRMIAALFVLAIAAVGILVVLEVIPRSVFSDTSVKLLAVGGIAAATVLVIGLLSKR